MTNGTCNTFHASVDTSNRLVGSPYQYDAAGNMIQDASHTYTYDAENRLTKVDGGSTASYAYDAENNRVQKTAGSVTTAYVFNPSGQVLHETDPNVTFNVHYIYLGAQVVAEMKNSTTYFAHSDHLGSTRLVTAIGPSQLQNSGFEQGSQGWNLCSGIPQIITDPVRAHSGSNFVWASTSTYACAISTQSIPVSPGNQVTFGGWTYLESGNSLLRWILVAYDSNNNQVGVAAASPNTASPQVWTQEVGSMTVPAGAAYVQIYCEIYLPTSTTAARFDDGFVNVSGVTVSIAQNLDYLPFGELVSTDSSITTHKFTGDERDAESNLDHTQFRQYSSSLGRWMHPDPAGLAAVDPSNPQSWNRYSYVLNNPLSAIDPFGLDCVFLNDAGDGVEEVAPELDSEGCGAQGGVYFAGSIDPNSLQFDPNSDFVFGQGTVGNSQFSCGGPNCDQGSLDAFANSLFAPSSTTVNGSLDNFGTGNGSWIWTFTTSFFTFAGGPGNVPTCAGQTLKHIGSEMFDLSELAKAQTAEAALKGASVVQNARAWGYAANQINTYGGKGLICPTCSSTFRSMAGTAKFLGEASEALPVLEAGYYAGKSIGPVSDEARNGTCAAAFPIF